MEKKIFQDVVPPKRTIRSIPLSINRSPISDFEVERKTKIVFRRPSKNFWGRVTKILLIFLILIGTVGVAFGLLLLFSSSEITVYPKTQKAQVSVVLESFMDDRSMSLFHIIAVSSTTKIVAVETDKEKEFDERAKGTITIFNNYSGEVQRLIKNTRFETSDGRIYRIDNSVVVPGQSEVNGVKTPGSIEAVVYADVSGEEYNLKVSDAGALSVPGFKGTPRFDYFYARLKTDIRGGFSGTKRYLEESEALPLKDSLKKEIETELKSSITAGIPSGYILIPGGFFMEYEEDSDKELGDKVIVSVSGTSYSLVTDKILFSKALARSVLQDYNEKDLEVRNIGDLEISVDDKSSQPWEKSSIIVNIAGEAEFIWSINKADLALAVIGQPKNKIRDILRNYEEIESADIILKPFWRSNFPTDSKKIKVIISLDSN